MKNYRNTAAALALALVFSVTAHADGLIHTGKASPTPTPTPAVNGIMVTEATNGVADTGGLIHTGRAGAAPGTADAAAVIALNLLQSVLTLF